MENPPLAGVAYYMELSIVFLEIKFWVLKKLAYNAVLDVTKFPFEVTWK